MGKVNLEVLKYMRKDCATGIRQFGEYNFHDKGPDECCEMPYDRLRALSPEDAAATLLEFAKESDHADKYVGCTIVAMDDWDELFDDTQPWWPAFNRWY